jgi:hypothetical protein
MRSDELHLLLEEELARCLARAGEVMIASTADDAAVRRCDGEGVTTTFSRTLRLGLRARQTLKTIHIVSGVGLLGTTAATLLLAVTATTSDDPASSREIYRLMSLQSAVFGIPLSLLALSSGILLGLATRWGVLRHWWTTAKLILILGVIVNGSLMIGPSVDDLRHGPPAAGTETRLVIAAAGSLAMLLSTTTLSVFKPRGRVRRGR